MSALRLEKITKGDRGFCCNGCQGTHGIRPGSHRCFIADHPVGNLCRDCAKQWPQYWSGAQVRLRIQTDPWPSVFILENPHLSESALFGPLLTGRFRKEDDPAGTWDEGSFRLDRLTLCEPLVEQMELAA